MRLVTLPDGTQVPQLGLGTWHLGERAKEVAAEVRALQAGIARGLTLLDTAEMYGNGGAESVVGQAIAGRREQVFVVSKAYPQNAGRTSLPRACEASLKRLGIETLDLYLLHWRGRIPLAETVEAFERLVSQGKIRRWGVSNLDVGDLEELVAAGGAACATDQVLYNLGSRGIEFALLPWCKARRMPVMASSPLGQGAVLKDRALHEVARRHSVSSATVALAWVLRRPDVIAIPKTASLEHLEELAIAPDLALTDEDRAALDRAFPPPKKAMPLEII
jgi:diketogulonate reductase-like aldo/keto reductase